MRYLLILLLLAGCGVTPEQAATIGVGVSSRQHRGDPTQPGRCALFGRVRQGLLDRPTGPGQELLPAGRAAARAHSPTARAVSAWPIAGAIRQACPTTPRTRRRPDDADPEPRKPTAHDAGRTSDAGISATTLATSASVRRSTSTTAAFIASAIAGGSLPASLTSARFGPLQQHPGRTLPLIQQNQSERRAANAGVQDRPRTC